ncbi:MAG: alpha/beta hydrolase [Bryobacterales bacterium]|nr:alpha/beta hydrolase [Bryobacterales bacterium]
MTMRIAFLFCLLTAAAWADAGLTGKWEVLATPDGKSAIKLDAELKQDGRDLSGTVNSAIGSGPVKNATVGDPDLTFQFMINKYTFDVKAVAGSDEIKGTFKGPGLMKGTFLAKRIAAPVPVEAGAAEGVEVGTIDGAAYRIDMPKNYNGSVILYCHGYSANPGQFDTAKPPSPLTKAFLDLGYAVAQSGYSKGGWAVKEGVEETEALRKHFAGKYGQPKRTYVMGHSMGGTITVAIAETYPASYDAALQMCGPIGPTLSDFQDRLFSTLVLYDYFFPDVIGSPVAVTEDVVLAKDFTDRVQKQAIAFPDSLEAFMKWGGFKNEVEMAGVVSFYAAIQRELMERAGGNPFDNRNVIYQGTGRDGQINRGVKRYAADEKARAYLKQYYTPKGEAKIPMLSLHTTYDPLVTADSANAYGDLLRLNGGDANYVQRFVDRTGHCTFTPQETVNAFRDLVTWKEQGTRPAPGEQK